MSTRNIVRNPRKFSENTLYGFDAEKHRDDRNMHHKGKHSYNSSEAVRIHYIKDKKQKQKEDASQTSLKKFLSNIDAGNMPK